MPSDHISPDHNSSNNSTPKPLAQNHVLPGNGDRKDDAASALLPPLLPEYLREVVNAELLAVDSDVECRRVPPFIPGMGPLVGKPLTLLDDTASVLIRTLPHLVVATNGLAKGILHRDESLDDLISRIVGTSPRVLVVDFKLARGLTGDRLIAAIRPTLRETVILGFSSDSDNGRFFMQAGANGCVEKDPLNPIPAVLKIASIVGSLAR